VLAGRGLVRLSKMSRFRSLARPVPAAALLAVICASPVVSLVRDQSDTHVYLSQEDLDATQVLDGQPPGNVLSSFDSGHFIPWLGRHKVYVGHWYMTLDLAAKDARVRRFFRTGTSPAWKHGFLAEEQIRYVFYGDHERRLGPLDPTLPLVPLYQGRHVALYHVDAERLDIAGAESEQTRRRAIEQATSLLARGEAARALHMLEGLAETYPEAFEVWAALASVRVSMGRMESARDALVHALAIRRDDSGARLLLRYVDQALKSRQ